jgi:hypothetical protein
VTRPGDAGEQDPAEYEGPPTDDQLAEIEEPCFDGCSEAECDCARCRAADAAWERLQGWDESGWNDDLEHDHHG